MDSDNDYYYDDDEDDDRDSLNAFTDVDHDVSFAGQRGSSIKVLNLCSCSLN